MEGFVEKMRLNGIYGVNDKNVVGYYFYNE